MRRLNVSNGMPVRKGDVLIELDAVMAEADMLRLRKERDFYRLDLARLEAERDGKDFKVPRGTWDPAILLNQQELSKTRRREFRSQIGALKQRTMAARSALRSAQRAREKYAALLPIVSGQRERMEALAQDGTVSLLEHQNYLQKEIETRQNLLTQKAKMERNKNAVFECP